MNKVAKTREYAKSKTEMIKFRTSKIEKEQLIAYCKVNQIDVSMFILNYVRATINLKDNVSS